MYGAPFDRFVKFPELTEVLEGWATAHPQLLRLDSIGRSHEDRDIWLCTVTNHDTGEHTERPAIWIDANIHATELTGSTAALYLLEPPRAPPATPDVNLTPRQCVEVRTSDVLVRDVRCEGFTPGQCGNRDA